MENTFNIKIINPTEKDLIDIGFDKTYIKNGLKKHKFISIKINNLNCAQANIIKQTAISVGCDCAVHREVITGNIDLSDCIISGSISHFEKITDKLSHQPFNLLLLGKQIKKLINKNITNTIIRNKEFEWDNNTYIMGILNITPDSFSDGGLYVNMNEALNHYKELVAQSTDIIDIGGESTRPGSSSVNTDEEIKRVIPIIQQIRELDNNTIVSIDTRNALTAKLAIKAGADIINDVSGLEHDKEMLQLITDNQIPIIITHSKPLVQNKQIIDEILDFFQNKINILITNGLEKNKIILDPGLGFNKSYDDNFEIINKLSELKTLGYPVLIGHSRKSFIQKTINSKDNNKLDIATTILSEKLIDNGANILRVHNVENHNLIKQIDKLFL